MVRKAVHSFQLPTSWVDSFENEDQPGDILVADTGRLNRELGFTCRMDFEEGLRRTVAWRRKQGGHS